MTITITIDCDNDAFQPRPGREIRRILEHAARVLQTTYDRGDMKLLDSNGNTCGKVTVSE